jgi:hypothetical protein
VPVIPLVFHVDYWNKLGWVDPFGRPEWSDRQRTYVSKLGKGNDVNTPQLVIQVRENKTQAVLLKTILFDVCMHFFFPTF